MNTAVRKSIFGDVRVGCPNPQCENQRKLHQAFCWRCWRKLPFHLQLQVETARQQRRQPQNLIAAAGAVRAYRRAVKSATKFLAA